MTFNCLTVRPNSCIKYNKTNLFKIIIHSYGSFYLKDSVLFIGFSPPFQMSGKDQTNVFIHIRTIDIGIV